MNANFPLTPSAEDCERHRIAASVLADGELAQDEVQTLVDHLVVCPGCADFYRRARALDAVLLAATVPAGGPPAPDAVWRRIVGRVDDRPAPPVRRSSPVVRWLPLAAILALAIGLAFVRPDGPRRSDAPPAVADGEGGPSIEIELEGEAGEMSDDRFVALTTELLQADRRYHRKMLEVMTVVSSRFEGEGESDEGVRPRLGSESRFTFRGGESPISRLERGEARL